MRRHSGIVVRTGASADKREENLDLVGQLYCVRQGRSRRQRRMFHVLPEVSSHDGQRQQHQKQVEGIQCPPCKARGEYANPWPLLLGRFPGR